MTTALAVLNRHGRTILIDIALLAALYLVPTFSHVTALPLYLFEPMRVALIIAMLFTTRANAFLLALTLPLASFVLSGHPAPLKALLMGIELTILVACYGYLAQRLRIPAFAALAAAIVAGKLVYYVMKFAALNAGLLGGSLVSTPLHIQLLLGVGTAAIFGLVETYRSKNSRKH